MLEREKKNSDSIEVYIEILSRLVDVFLYSVFWPSLRYLPTVSVFAASTTRTIVKIIVSVVSQDCSNDIATWTEAHRYPTPLGKGPEFPNVDAVMRAVPEGLAGNHEMERIWNRPGIVDKHITSALWGNRESSPDLLTSRPGIWPSCLTDILIWSQILKHPPKGLRLYDRISTKNWVLDYDLQLVPIYCRFPMMPATS